MGFASANRYALAAIVEASQSRHIVASQDIFDDRGFKLWARDQRVTPSLQQRLLERKLKTPLESCLHATDGVTVVELHSEAQRFLADGSPLAAGLAPWANAVCKEIRHLPLHSVAQLLLTTVQASRPEVFVHAVQAMVLSGAMSLHQGHSRFQVRLGLLGGLLHDLGEMYVNPEYLDSTTDLGAGEYRHVVVHPQFGAMLLQSLTDYPVELSRAVGEHHERLHGGGYPKGLIQAQISPLGRQLAAVETLGALAARSSSPSLWSHAFLSLRLIPGEYDAAAIQFVGQRAQAESNLPLDSLSGATRVDPVQALRQIDERLEGAQAEAMRLAQSGGSPQVRSVAARAVQQLAHLRTAWNAAGLWSLEHVGTPPLLELDELQRELAFRCRALRRDCLWQEDRMSPQDLEQLESLWQCLRGDVPSP
ncbi:MAG: HD domain-containing protein [Curvibacter sp.]|nr:HD domain-containing protein [Curvibacter sp.]